MEKKDINWSSLGFGYMPTDYRFVAHWKDGKWDEGEIITDPTVHISECAGVLQYAQTCFEGLKVYTTKDGSIVAFRPDQNAKRMQDSAKRLIIPEVSEEMFLRALDEVVKANAAWVPPYGSGASLYIRPFVYGSGPVIGVAPAPEYEFRLIATPVGPYFKGGVKPIRIRVSDYDRAAPHGTGHIKAGLNYAMSLYPIVEAHEEGFAENMYLDAATRTYVEETGGANFIFITKDGKLVTPKSDSVKDFVEIGLCGTAAVISPVGSITHKDGEILVPSGMDGMGPVLTKIRETLSGLQMCDLPAPEGWVRKIM